MENTLFECVYTDMARRTGVFRQSELEVLGELVREAMTSPKTSYRMILEETEGKIAGFVIFGMTPGTLFTWDIYWLVVDSSFQRAGLGKKLLNKAEKEMLSRSTRAVIRVETSSREEYLPARTFYSRHGFNVVGTITDFYGENDDLVIYAKHAGSTA